MSVTVFILMPDLILMIHVQSDVLCLCVSKSNQWLKAQLHVVSLSRIKIICDYIIYRKRSKNAPFTIAGAVNQTERVYQWLSSGLVTKLCYFFIFRTTFRTISLSLSLYIYRDWVYTYFIQRVIIKQIAKETNKHRI